MSDSISGGGSRCLRLVSSKPARSMSLRMNTTVGPYFLISILSGARSVKSACRVVRRTDARYSSMSLRAASIDGCTSSIDAHTSSSYERLFWHTVLESA